MWKAFKNIFNNNIDLLLSVFGIKKQKQKTNWFSLTMLWILVGISKEALDKIEFTLEHVSPPLHFFLGEAPAG